MLSRQCTANNQAKKTATKKLGADIPKLDKVNTHLSHAVFTFNAENTPNPIPNKEAIIVEIKANKNVAGTVEDSISLTDSPEIYERDKYGTLSKTKY